MGNNIKEKEQKYKILRVTVVQQYYIPMINDERTEINGWKMDEVIKDWFDDDYPIDSYHATRDTHRIGNSSKVIGTEVVDPEDTEEFKKSGK